MLSGCQVCLELWVGWDGRSVGEVLGDQGIPWLREGGGTVGMVWDAIGIVEDADAELETESEALAVSISSTEMVGDVIERESRSSKSDDARAVSLLKRIVLVLVPVHNWAISIRRNPLWDRYGTVMGPHGTIMGP
ncbi:hypothetical protein BDP27DRAFT_1369404 [Rhodocollybia butyracea]|uniref:Uncharacterized protein n=1 Tax=Rhodocollybia butyracea TaxID=206335 RepID=A0A9P5TZN4_9AGAR|nr:hypothetical protein BDP27DRAFT_1369404 [Rhodocollybia butyracea]